MNAQHSSVTAEHYTPTEIIEAARSVMTNISLDPASCAEANKVVGALDYFTESEDGLVQDWWGNVWLNPPGGSVRTGKKVKSKAGIWWEKLVSEYVLGNIQQAIFLGFSIEILATSQDASMSCLEFPLCVPRRRLQFLKQDPDTGKLVKGKSPTHSNVIVYLPPTNNTAVARTRFEQAFAKFGAVR